MVLNASISRVLGQRPMFYCPLFVLCFVFWLGRVRISILQCNQCTTFLRKNKIIIIILQAVDGATIVAIGHRCSNRSQHFLSLSTGRYIDNIKKWTRASLEENVRRTEDRTSWRERSCAAGAANVRTDDAD